MELRNEKYDAHFVNSGGEQVDGAKVVCPLFTKIGNKTIFLGTAFFVTTFNGLMLTAKHCLVDKNRWYDNLFVIQFLDEKKYLIRHVFKSYWNTSDVAVLLLHNYKSNSTGKLLSQPNLSLTAKFQKPGEIIGSYAYPLTTVYSEDPKEVVKINDEYHFGKIEEYHLQGTPFLKNSCYQSSMHIKGGSSGGPVVNSNGYIFAINSTGSDVAENLEPYSFLSPVAYCLNIKIDTDDGRKISIKELIEMGFVNFEG